jgi:hypothetical protein
MRIILPTSAVYRDAGHAVPHRHSVKSSLERDAVRVKGLFSGIALGIPCLPKDIIVMQKKAGFLEPGFSGTCTRMDETLNTPRPR